MERQEYTGLRHHPQVIGFGSIPGQCPNMTQVMSFGSILQNKNQAAPHLEQNPGLQCLCQHWILHVKEVVHGATQGKVTDAIGMVAAAAVVALMVNWTVQAHLYCALHVYVDCVHLCCENAGCNRGKRGGTVVNQA